MNAVQMREKQVNIRLTDEESERFEKVARHYGLNVPGAIRLLMKREEQDLDDASRERWAKGAEQWERDKAYVESLAQYSNIDFDIKFDDRARTVTLESRRARVQAKREGLTRDEAIQALESWSNSAIVEVDPVTRFAKFLRGSEVLEVDPSQGGTIANPKLVRRKR